MLLIDVQSQPLRTVAKQALPVNETSWPRQARPDEQSRVALMHGIDVLLHELMPVELIRVMGDGVHPWMISRWSQLREGSPRPHRVRRSQDLVELIRIADVVDPLETVTDIEADPADNRVLEP